MTAPADGAAAEQAVVVFSDTTEIPLLRCLRRGFRHCFVVVRRGGAWVVIDPLAHRTAVDVVTGAALPDGAEVAAFYRAHGLSALVVAVRRPPHRLAPVRPYSCVEAVKRVIGRRAPRVFTPWQLHKFLLKENILDKTRKLG